MSIGYAKYPYMFIVQRKNESGIYCAYNTYSTYLYCFYDDTKLVVVLRLKLNFDYMRQQVQLDYITKLVKNFILLTPEANKAV